MNRGTHEGDLMSSNNSNNVRSRRSFLQRNLAAGAALASAGAINPNKLAAREHGRLTSGDAAVLRFVAAAELIETDLWVQYAELGGVTTEPTNSYQLAFQNLDC